MFKKLTPLALLVCSTSALATNLDTTPAGSVGFEYSFTNIQTNDELEGQFHVLTGTYNWYYTNNILLHLTLGAGVKEDDMVTSSNLDSGWEGELKYVASVDFRYEYPFSNEIAAYVSAGVGYFNFEASQWFSENKYSSFGYKYGAGLSYVLTRNTAIYTEYRQDMNSSKIDANSWSLGYKFTF